MAGVSLILVAAVVAYAPCLGGGFILDDYMLLADNATIRAADGLYRFWFTTEAYDYWPISNSVLWIEWRLWGTSPSGYHITNLLLHIVEASLIWAILRRLAIPGAFVAALLFAVHPVNVETVAWIAQRKSLLAMLFYLLSILSYLKAEETASSVAPPDRWYWLSLAAFVAAMLSKGSVAVLPVVLLGALWWMRPLTRRDGLRMVPVFVVAVGLTLVNIWFQTHGAQRLFRTPTFIERVLGAAAAVWFYIYKALLPIHLSLVYPRWQVDPMQWQWWLPLLAAAGVTLLLCFYRGAWGRPWLFAWGYFCVALAPALGFTDVGFMEHSLVADHYQHLALIAVTALLGAGWDTWRRNMPESASWMPNVGAGAVVVLLVGLTWQQSGLYRDSITLYEATLKEGSNSWMVHNNLAVALRENGRLDESIEHCEQALQLRPDYPEAHNNLGNALRDSGKLAPAAEHYQQAIRLRPDYAEAHNNLAIVLARKGDLDAAIDHFREALRIKPDYADAEYNLNLALGMKQKAAAEAAGSVPP